MDDWHPGSSLTSSVPRKKETLNAFIIFVTCDFGTKKSAAGKSSSKNILCKWSRTSEGIQKKGKGMLKDETHDIAISLFIKIFPPYIRYYEL